MIFVFDVKFSSQYFIFITKYFFNPYFDKIKIKLTFKGKSFRAVFKIYCIDSRLPDCRFSVEQMLHGREREREREKS